MDIFALISPFLKRPFELFAATGDETGRLLNLNLSLDLNLPRRLRLDLSVHPDLALENHGLRAGPRFGETAFDQEDIEPELHFAPSDFVLSRLRYLISRTSSRGKLRLMPGEDSISM